LQQIQVEVGQQAKDKAIVGNFLNEAATASKEMFAAEQDEAQRLKQVSIVLEQLVRTMSTSHSVYGTALTEYDTAKVLLDVKNIIQAELIQKAGLSKSVNRVMEHVMSALSVEEGAKESYTVQLIEFMLQRLKNGESSEASAEANEAVIRAGLRQVMQHASAAQRQERAETLLQEARASGTPEAAPSMSSNSRFHTHSLMHQLANLDSKTTQMTQTLMTLMGELHNPSARYIAHRAQSAQAVNFVQGTQVASPQFVQVPVLQPIAQPVQVQPTLR